MPDKVIRWRKRAADLHKIAESPGHPQKTEILRLARQWERMAALREERLTREAGVLTPTEPRLSTTDNAAKNPAALK